MEAETNLSVLLHLATKLGLDLVRLVGRPATSTHAPHGESTAVRAHATLTLHNKSIAEKCVALAVMQCGAIRLQTAIARLPCIAACNTSARARSIRCIARHGAHRAASARGGCTRSTEAKRELAICCAHACVRAEAGWAALAAHAAAEIDDHPAAARRAPHPAHTHRHGHRISRACDQLAKERVNSARAKQSARRKEGGGGAAGGRPVASEPRQTAAGPRFPARTPAERGTLT